MNRGYRMRYHNIDDVDVVPVEPVDPAHRATRIIVYTMNNDKYTLFTERDGETFLHVKVALLPHLVLPKIPSLRRLALSLRNADGHIEIIDVADSAILPADNEVVLELLIREPEWTPEQERIVRQSRYTIGRYDTETPDRMEAALWGMQDAIDTVSLRNLPLEHIETIMNVIPTNIERLSISDIGFNANEMAELFAIIARNNTLRTVIIGGKHPDANGSCAYRMNDLADWLRVNTSLTTVYMGTCDFILDEDVTTLSRVLTNHPTLAELDLFKNIPLNHENLGLFVDSLQTIITMGNRVRNQMFLDQDVHGVIDIHWINPNILR